MKLHDVSIESEGGRTRIKVDGVQITRAIALNVSVLPDHFPTVDIRVAPFNVTWRMDGAKVGWNFEELPEEMERALLAQLQAKYGDAPCK